MITFSHYYFYLNFGPIYDHLTYFQFVYQTIHPDNPNLATS